MLPELHAEHQLDQIEAASFPHMTASDRRRLLREKQSSIGRKARPQRASADDLAAIGIPVQYVDKEST